MPIVVITSTDASAEDDVHSMITQPLLDLEDKPAKKLTDDDDDDEHDDERARNGTKCNSKLVLVGVLLGFCVQIISLGAYALLLLNFRGDSSDSNLLDVATRGIGNDVDVSNFVGWITYLALTALTEIDLACYIFVWLAFSAIMTRGGMAYVRASCEDKNTPIKRRAVFILMVRFLTGIVLGAFISWVTIDCFLGWPIDLLPIVATVIVDLILCWMMLICYDLGKSNKNDDEDEEDAGADSEDDGCCC